MGAVEDNIVYGMELAMITTKMIKALVAEWQKILKLEHWEITISVVPSKEFKAGHADIDVNFMYFIADMRIANIKFSQEALDKLIIHELLHVHLAGMNILIGTPEHTAEEQAVQIISRVIYDGYK